MMNRISYIDDFLTWEKEFEFFIPIKVRFSETDMFGHLNNVVPFTYFEEGRIEFFKSKGLMKEWLREDSEAMIVTADLQCNYLKQVFFDEQLKLYVKANKFGSSSADIHYMAKNESGEVCFVGRGTMVHVSKQTGKSTPWPLSVKNT